jgi:hypothetical protein
MPLLTKPSDYVFGTISLTNGSVDFTGVGTAWLLVGLTEGDLLIDVAGATQFWAIIDEITTNTAGKLTRPWAGPDLVNVEYRIRFTSDGTRSTAQAAMLRQELGNGNIQALASLEGSANQIAVFTGPGAMTLVPKTDLVSGAAYDVQVANLAARAAYNGQAAGYSVLVSDVGDGRAAIYSKNSNTSADWSAAAYVTGPVGPVVTFEAGTTTTLPAGADATVSVVPVTGGYELELGVPAGRGAVIMGTYSPATAYVLDDAVLYNGSTWIALQSTTGNAPPTLPTTSNAYWQLLARQGTDGAGTVNSVVAGSGIAVDNTDPASPKISTVAPEIVKTASYAIPLTDAGKVITFNSATATNPTLPALASTNGEHFFISNIGVGDTNIYGPGLLSTLAQGSAVEFWPSADKSVWRSLEYAAASSYLAKLQNLADVPNKVAARASLGLAWEKVLDEQRTNVASIDLINLGSYRRLRGKLFVRPTANTHVSARVSDTNGANFYQGASDYENSYIYGIAGNTAFQEDTNVAQIRVSITGSIGIAGQDGAAIEFEVDRFNEGGAYSWLTYKAIARTSGALLSAGSGGGRCKQAVVFNGLQFFPGTGTISYCDILLEGLR